MHENLRFHGCVQFVPFLNMHTTDSIDYGVVISGEVYLELDDGVEVLLKPEDCVVQNGTRHAWRNRGSVPCLMAFVMIGATRR